MVSGGYEVTESDVPDFHYITHLRSSQFTADFCRTITRASGEALDTIRGQVDNNDAWRITHDAKLAAKVFGFDTTPFKQIEPAALEVRMTAQKGWG